MYLYQGNTMFTGGRSMCDEHRVVTDNTVRQEKKHPVHTSNVRYVRKPSKKTMAQIKMYFAEQEIGRASCRERV